MNELRYFSVFIVLFLTVTLLPCGTYARYKGIERPKCKSREGLPFRPHSDQRHRIHAVREEMRIRASLHGSEIDAYIITSYDDHMNEDIADQDKRRQYISGFTGPTAVVAITLHSVALWTDEQFLAQANSELNCDWKIFSTSEEPNLTEWLRSELAAEARVGADPHVVPHYLWLKWESELHQKFIRLVRVNRNLIDMVWHDRPQPIGNEVHVQPYLYAGEKWQTKVRTLRDHLVQLRCDAIVVTSLTEIAYLLNLRGNDLPHTPVFKAYAIVTQREVFLYTNRTKLNDGIQLNHLDTEPCATELCVRLKDYDAIWRDLRMLAHQWRRVLIPSRFTFDHGASEAIFSGLHQHLIFENPSPIIFMRAVKNELERKAMQRAHVLDGAAMCEALSLLERRFLNHEQVTEVSAAKDVDRARYAIRSNRGLAFETTVAFGPHGAIPNYQTFNESDLVLTDQSTIIVHSGGQYLEGTTEVTRTLHFGEPTDEQKRAYTNVLRGILSISTLVFPENLNAAQIDSLVRNPVWGAMDDYAHSTGHGIGAFLSVRESPINLVYSETHNVTFKDGYFFTNEPVLYKKGQYGIRIENVLEVTDPGKRHTSGTKFLKFEDISLVPYEPKLIEKGLLSVQEKRWLNEYNARIRTLVGEELKAQLNMQAFYWMMNKTRHIIEYYPESEYRKHNNSDFVKMTNAFGVILILNVLIYFTNWM